MKLNYINQIKANISIYASKKTSNILDGTYKSIYTGKSMNFENLRDYVIGDDVKDIDWKSSSRTGKLLVKQFIAEKKHNILFVMDSGIKFDADTDLHENKKQLALYLAGTLGYIAIKNNDYVGMIYQNDKIIFKPFKYNLYNLEQYLCEYDKLNNSGNFNIENILKHIYNKIQKRMIIFVITDIDGINNIDENVLKKLNQIHDVLFININDNYMFGENIYDVNNNKYIPNLILKNSKLNNIEKQIKNDLLKKNELKLKRNNISIISISSIKQINSKIIELLEEHKNANTI